MEVIRSNDKWSVFIHGPEGKKRPAHDIIIPKDVTKNKVADYLADLLHEWATPRNNSVSRTDLDIS